MSPVRRELIGQHFDRDRRRGMQLAKVFKPKQDHKIRLASQIGITYTIPTATPALESAPRERCAELLRNLRKDLPVAGLSFVGVESRSIPAEKIKHPCGGVTRKSTTAIRALAEIGVPLVSTT